MLELRLTAVDALDENVRRLQFSPSEPLTFQPGQWLNLFADIGEGPQPIKRSYSIASAPRADGEIELAVTRVVGGPMSEHLHRLAIGETIRATAPTGLFLLEPPVRPVLFVATGTGVAPFRAMLQAWPAAHRDVPVTLLFGARTPSALIFRDELAPEAVALKHYRYVPTLSRPPADWSGRSGWVTAHVAEEVRALGDCDVYVCGLTKMVSDVRALCRKELGVPRERFHSERYD
jgi:CDP-4-dehydro-6-deoxyglucose reductase